jgi:hypothetical protein
LGLYIDDAEKKSAFNDLRKDLFKSYVDSNMTDAKVCNMLYLLGYSELLELCPNSCIDKDDLIHLMIALVNNPQLVKEDELYLKKKLTSALAGYIIELIIQKNNDYIYYMLLIPGEYFVEEVSRLISSSGIFKDFDWSLFKNKLPEKMYHELVKATLYHEHKFGFNSELVAQKYDELIQDYESSMEVSLELLFTSILKFRIDSDIIQRSEKMILKCFDLNHVLKSKHIALF